MTVTFDKQGIQAAYETFLIRTRILSNDGGPDIGAVLTNNVRDRNTAIAQVWGTENLPGGLSAANNPGWWELAFAGAISIGALTVDPNYLANDARIKLYREFDRTVPAAVTKMIYLNQPEHEQKLSLEQREILARLGGPRGYKQLVNGGF
jgi:hypothetical protein